MLLSRYLWTPNYNNNKRLSNKFADQPSTYPSSCSGLQSVMPVVHLPSVILAICTVHYHFSLAVVYMSFCNTIRGRNSMLGTRSCCLNIYSSKLVSIRKRWSPKRRPCQGWLSRSCSRKSKFLSIFTPVN